MAAATQGKTPAGKATAEIEEERGPTMRLVLRQERVLVISGLTLTDAEEKALREELKKVGIKNSSPQDAWVVVGEFEGASKEKAIEAHTGEPGTADAKTGTFKAPTVKAFAGGLRLVAPPKPLVEKESIE